MKLAIQAPTPEQFMAAVVAFADDQESSVTIKSVISKDGYLQGYAETSTTNSPSIVGGNTIQELVTNLQAKEDEEDGDDNVFAAAPSIIEHAGALLAICNAIPAEKI